LDNRRRREAPASASVLARRASGRVPPWATASWPWASRRSAA